MDGEDSKPPPAPPKTCGLAIASGCLGIVAFVIPYIGILFEIEAFVGGYPALFIVALFIYFICAILAIAAVICGHVARNRIRKSPRMIGGNRAAIAGLVFGYAYFVVLPLVIALTMFVFIEARKREQKKLCITNMRQIEDAVQQYKIKNNTEPTSVWQLVEYMPYMPFCPVAKSDPYALVNGKPVCPGTQADPNPACAACARHKLETKE